MLDLLTEAFSRLPESFSGQAVRGDGTDEDVLRRAGAEGADNFIALTEGDNRNVLAAQMAAENLGIPNVVAKINDPVRANAYSSLGIGTICRTTMMVDAMAGFLGEPTGRPLPGVSPPTGHHPGRPWAGRRPAASPASPPRPPMPAPRAAAPAHEWRADRVRDHRWRRQGRLLPHQGAAGRGP